MSTVTNTQVFTITKGRFKGCKVIPLVRSIVPIYVAKGKTCYAVSQPELVRLNSQAIARGFSRTLWPSKIGKLSKDLFFPILAAFEHTSREGYRNVRLELVVGPHEGDLHHAFLDIAHSDWNRIKKAGMK